MLVTASAALHLGALGAEGPSLEFCHSMGCSKMATVRTGWSAIFQVQNSGKEKAIQVYMYHVVCKITGFVDS